ncbi:ribonucleotide-diphosphate reductase subunit beta [Salininema proteolyticum]|uniref:Ribonucleotide-diphosphate reductase subunit beta n=1 Tax=Salininema proteolyticum TaxID=1607685 RepID=A0ABV8U2U9_9ACTN
MPRWSTLLDEATLDEMSELPAEAVIGHAESTFASRPTYQTLYRAWDRQHWSSEELDFERDAEQWKRIPKATRRRLERLIRHFLIGEYSGLDLLAPISLCAPDEDALLYLGTQVGDEARHTRLLDRIAREAALLESDGLRAALTESWREATPAQKALNRFEAELVGSLTSGTAGYDEWMRTVAVFHLVTEGVLALPAQRGLVRTLSGGTMLQNVKAGFVAMTRDEARHVAFGIEALRRGVGAHGTPARVDATAESLRRALALAVAVELPETPTEEERDEALLFARDMEAEAHRRLRLLDLPAGVVQWIGSGIADAVEAVAAAPTVERAPA